MVFNKAHAIRVESRDEDMERIVGLRERLFGAPVHFCERMNDARTR